MNFEKWRNIAELIIQITEFLRNLERMRIEIIQDPSCDFFLLFRILDKYGQGYLTNKDLHNFLENKVGTVDISSSKFLIYYKNNNNLNYLNIIRKDVLYYNNFLNLFKISNKKIFLDNLNKKRYFNGKINDIILNKIAEYFFYLIKYYELTQEYKMKLLNEYGDYFTDIIEIMKNYKDDISGIDNDIKEINFINTGMINSFLNNQELINTEDISYSGYTFTDNDYLLFMNESESEHDILLETDICNLLSPFNIDKRVDINNIRGHYFTQIQRNGNILKDFIENQYLNKEERLQNDDKMEFHNTNNKLNTNINIKELYNKYNLNSYNYNFKKYENTIYNNKIIDNFDNLLRYDTKNISNNNNIVKESFNYKHINEFVNL